MTGTTDRKSQQAGRHDRQALQAAQQAAMTGRHDRQPQQAGTADKQTDRQRERQTASLNFKCHR